METIIIVTGIVTGVYEVVTRIIPSVKDWTLLGNVMKLLSGLSDILNRKK